MKTKTAVLLSTLVILTGIFLPSNAAEAKKSTSERFYGKITTIDVASKSFSIHNKTRKLDAVFAWNENTQFVANKQAIPANQLKIGDFLMVSYRDENGVKAANKVVLRTNFGKRKTTD